MLFQSSSQQDKERRRALAPLGVDFGRARPPAPSTTRSTRTERADGQTAAQLLVAYWNELAQVGTKVRYYPRWGAWGQCIDTELTRPATLAKDGSPVLWLQGVSGYVSAWHCEPLELVQLRDRGVR